MRPHYVKTVESLHHFNHRISFFIGHALESGLYFRTSNSPIIALIVVSTQQNVPHPFLLLKAT